MPDNVTANSTEDPNITPRLEAIEKRLDVFLMDDEPYSPDWWDKAFNVFASIFHSDPA